MPKVRSKLVRMYCSCALQCSRNCPARTVGKLIESNFKPYDKKHVCTLTGLKPCYFKQFTKRDEILLNL